MFKYAMIVCCMLAVLLINVAEAKKKYKGKGYGGYGGCGGYGR